MQVLLIVFNQKFKEHCKHVPEFDINEQLAIVVRAHYVPDKE